MKVEKDKYSFEYTDTFGGEPNYSWVHRGTVMASSLRGAVTLVKRELGLTGVSCRRFEFGDGVWLYPRNSCTVIFIYWEEIDTVKND